MYVSHSGRLDDCGTRMAIGMWHSFSWHALLAFVHDVQGVEEEGACRTCLTCIGRSERTLA